MVSKHARICTAVCRCGTASLELIGNPIITAACYCTSCQAAGARIESLHDATSVLEADGGTSYVLVRKDRMRCLKGAENLGEFRLTPQSTTRRIIATCCNSPMFLEFKNGHWLSVYLERLPANARPRLDTRTMTKDRRPGVEFNDSIPGSATQSAKFMLRLLSAWVAMKFRSPPIDYIKGTLHEQAQ